jgi:hypothetical protein
MSDITLSGFVQASYFYNTRETADGQSDALPVEYKTQFLFDQQGQDHPGEQTGGDGTSGTRASARRSSLARMARNLNTGGELQSFEALREAYVEIERTPWHGLEHQSGPVDLIVELGNLATAAQRTQISPRATNGGSRETAQPQACNSVKRSRTPWTLRFACKTACLPGLWTATTARRSWPVSVSSPTASLWVNLIGWFSKESANNDVAGGSVIGGYQNNREVRHGLRV